MQKFKDLFEAVQQDIEPELGEIVMIGNCLYKWTDTVQGVKFDFGFYEEFKPAIASVESRTELPRFKRDSKAEGRTRKEYKFLRALREGHGKDDVYAAAGGD